MFLSLNDIKDEVVKLKAIADFKSGIMKGVNGRPTFFINDTRYNGSW
ncbi:MAG: hypothetical protein H7Z13_05340 [Ferruginibacter sp.]|nr:hypothetical protein [Ferruginibacter sp.]